MRDTKFSIRSIRGPTAQAVRVVGSRRSELAVFLRVRIVPHQLLFFRRRGSRILCGSSRLIFPFSQTITGVPLSFARLITTSAASRQAASTNFGGKRRQSGGNEVGVEKLPALYELWKEFRRKCRLAGSIWTRDQIHGRWFVGSLTQINSIQSLLGTGFELNLIARQKKVAPGQLN